MTRPAHLGPLMCGIAGTQLQQAERDRLVHPLVGGVILFTRNYESSEQLKSLTAEIRGLRNPPLIIAVDHEGGRVQRFRDGFAAIPAMGHLGDLFDRHPQKALRLAREFAWMMAAELLHHGVDLSFAPVLDIGNPVSSVIGDRAFHRRPAVIAQLANAWIRGMADAGMASVGKHFPGHGSVEGDSHHLLPVDRRSLEDIMMLDVEAFRHVMVTRLDGIMMAHVVYSAVDEQPAGYSSFWTSRVLRSDLGFEGVVFSDDLDMSAADVAGGHAERARRSLQAGCDMILICNNPQGTMEVIEAMPDFLDPASQLRLMRLHGRPVTDIAELYRTRRWREALGQLQQFTQIDGISEGDDLFDQGR